MNAIIGLLLLLLFCFIIGIAFQVGWQILTGTPTRDTTLGTAIVLPTVIAAVNLPVEGATTTPSITASKTVVASKTPKAKAKASRTPTITLTPTLTEYIVGAGDTLGAIAVEYDISIEGILAMNPELNPNRLSIGDVIIIPTLTRTLTTSRRQTTTPSVRRSNSPFISPTRTPPKRRTPRSTATKKTSPIPPKHTIQAGDTLLDIAFEYNVSVEALLEANPSLNPSALRIGEVIVIATE
jgi:LysM repeat protein